MRFTENRTLAKIVLVVSILASIFLLGSGGLYAERADVLNVFEEGTDTSLSSRHSLDAYLDTCSEKAQILAGEAGNFLPDAPEIAALLDNANLLATKTDVTERYAAYAALRPDVENLYSKILGLSLSDGEMTNIKLAYYDFKGAVNRVENDQYGTLARAFNKKISGFPANVVANLFKIAPLETFGG